MKQLCLALQDSAYRRGSTFLSSSLTHTHILSFFPLFSISPLPLPLLISVLHLLLPHSLHLCVLLYITALCCLSLLAGHFSCQLSFFPCSSTRCPQARHSPTLPSSPAFLPRVSLQHFHPCFLPPLLPFCPQSRVHAVEGGVLIARLADRHRNGCLGACLCMCVCVCVYGWVFKEQSWQ